MPARAPHVTEKGYIRTLDPGISMSNSVEVTVKHNGQDTDAEHCSVHPEILANIGSELFQQIRILGLNKEPVLYTVKSLEGEKLIKMSEDALSRIQANPNVNNKVLVSGEVTASLNEAEAQKKGEFIERLTDDGTSKHLVVIAPHGGLIEKSTDLQAEYVSSQLAGKGAVCWVCKGWSLDGTRKRAFEQWHITSNDIHIESFPKLKTIIGRGFDNAISFHGFNKTGQGIDEDVLIGGSIGQDVKDTIMNSIQEKVPSLKVKVVSKGEKYSGTAPSNIVNRLAKGRGLQLEQSNEARIYWQQIADAVTAVYNLLI
jgi:phage replication-related protein YjqB (UPF0714/DUF867 family)